jgi:hypothetical protein
MVRLKDVQSEVQGRSTKGVRLIVGGDSSGIQSVEVTAPHFFLGRSPSCQVQLGSQLVSRVHVLIRHHDGRVFVRDLETTNGTVLNGRTIHSQEIEVSDRDRIMVGPYLFTIAIDPCREDDPPRFEPPSGRLEFDRIDDPGPALFSSGASDLGEGLVGVEPSGALSRETLEQ